MIDVLVIGGGPSGLTLAILLIEAGCNVKVLESRTVVGEHSRAIGIHPPGLDVLHRAGIGDAALANGVRICRGIGISRGRIVAELEFGSIPSSHRFVLSLPQNRTVELLRQRLHGLDPTALMLGTEFLSLATHKEFITAQAVGPNGVVKTFDCHFLIGADGTRSSVREEALVPFQGSELSDRYIMGDYPDGTDFGAVAALFLHTQGITESFPLPRNKRRWVCWVGTRETASLPELVARRTGHQVNAEENTMLSRFTTQEFSVGAMAHGNVVLIGDAAHEISPIGGQGMTLGLVDAAELAPLLVAALNGAGPRRRLDDQFSRFSALRLAAARRAARQARLNMRLGRPLWGPSIGLRDALARAVFSSKPVTAWVASTFTMTRDQSKYRHQARVDGSDAP
ncbi:FAD-dependent oxidoreductase [Paeniglutamicibacter antarcticus]|uniref:NAD(P)/FAD-dependent oxidoreductase n=1 Tax=Paeniglutamicibacter antarcticus TaxID=494023 RepID=A0ABP9THM4_9MICC